MKNQKILKFMLSIPSQASLNDSEKGSNKWLDKTHYKHILYNVHYVRAIKIGNS